MTVNQNSTDNGRPKDIEDGNIVEMPDWDNLAPARKIELKREPQKTTDLRKETEIVWDESPAQLSYVRVTRGRAGTRTRPVPWHGPGRRVGYAVWADSAPNSGSPGIFRRRVFYLKDYDATADLPPPVEAVDPDTLAPRRPGTTPQQDDNDD